MLMIRQKPNELGDSKEVKTIKIIFGYEKTGYTGLKTEKNHKSRINSKNTTM